MPGYGILSLGITRYFAVRLLSESETADSPIDRLITESISSYIRAAYMTMQYPLILLCGGSSWLSADTWLFPGLLRGCARYPDATVDAVQGSVDAKDSMKDRKDTMWYLLAAKDPETGANLEIAGVSHALASGGVNSLASTTKKSFTSSLHYTILHG